MPLCIHPPPTTTLDQGFDVSRVFLFVLYGDAVLDRYVYIHIYNFVYLQLYMKCLVLHILLCDFLSTILLGLSHFEICRFFHSCSRLYNILFCEHCITDYMFFAQEVQDIYGLTISDTVYILLYMCEGFSSTSIQPLISLTSNSVQFSQQKHIKSLIFETKGTSSRLSPSHFTLSHLRLLGYLKNQIWGPAMTQRPQEVAEDKVNEA